MDYRMNPVTKETIGRCKLALIDFYAPWCGSCQTMDSVLEVLEERIGEKASILRVDVDENPGILSVFRVRSLPTFILFKSGKILWQKSGVVTAKELEKAINENA